MSIDRLGRTNLSWFNIQLGKYLEPTEIKRTDTGYEFRSEWHEEIVERIAWEKAMPLLEFGGINYSEFEEKIQNKITEAANLGLLDLHDLPATLSGEIKAESCVVLASSDGKEWGRQ